MNNPKIRSISENSYQDFLDQGSRPSFVQQKASRSILSCSPGHWGSTFPSVRTADTLNSTTIPTGTVTAPTVRR